MRIVLGILFATLWCGVCFSAETRKTEIGGHVYHQLEECEFERGIASTHYNFRTKRNAKPIIEITDICFDRSSGIIEASESENDLTLVRQDTGDDSNGQSIDYFEVLAPNTDGFERWRADAGRFDVPGSTKRHDFVWLSYQRPTSKQLGWKTTGTQHKADVSLRGFLAERWDSSANSDGYYFYISGLDELDHQRSRDPQYLGRETPIVSWQGPSRFKDGSLDAALFTVDDEFSTGDGQLSLQIDESGNVRGTGVLRARNSRLAGINEYDWKTTEWRIEALVGHVVGQDGKTIKAVAIAKGETIDHDGHVNPVYASLDITGYDREYAMTWQDPTIASAFADIGFEDVSTADRITVSSDYDLEKQLSLVGFNPGDIDGVFDDQTFAAIQQFQRHLGLAEEGLISEKQRQLLTAWAKAIE